MKMYRLIAIALMTGVGAVPATMSAWGAGGRADRGPRIQGRTGRAGRNATPEERIDRREANQEKRIEQGIKHDQLTGDEATRLKGMEDNIQSLETQFKSDGTLSRDETKKLRNALHDASLQIWAERHDTEGKQKPVSRLGKDVFAPDALTAKIENGSVTRPEARKFLGDFHKMVNIKRRLSADTLTDDQRAKLQAEYNELLNEYFTTKAPAPKT